MIKSINTHYNGNYFRSRLEAKWAYFFDLVGIKYLYEPQGYIMPDGTMYLPDFWLPEVVWNPYDNKDATVGIFAEVKGVMSESDHKKIENFVIGRSIFGPKGYVQTVVAVLGSLTDDQAVYTWDRFSSQLLITPYNDDCVTGRCNFGDAGNGMIAFGWTCPYQPTVFYDKAVRANCARFEHGEKKLWI